MNAPLDKPAFPFQNGNLLRNSEQGVSPDLLASTQEASPVEFVSLPPLSDAETEPASLSLLSDAELESASSSPSSPAEIESVSLPPLSDAEAESASLSLLSDAELESASLSSPSDTEVASKEAVSEKQTEKPLFLLIEKGPAAGQAFQIVQGSCTIGRASVVDLCLKHPSVSRRHAQLKRLGDHLYVRDLGSQNGTYVNRQRISNEAEVFAGDTLIIGASLLKLKDALLSESVPPPIERPHSKPVQSRWAPYSTALIASLTTSFSTLVAMFLLKLVFQPSAPSAEVEITPGFQLSAPVAAAPPPMPLEVPLVDIAPSPSPVENTPPPDKPDKGKTASLSPAPPAGKASILEAFKQGRAEDALRMAKEAKQTLLAEQLAAFLSKRKTAERLWKEVSKTKPPRVRHALAAHEEALLAASRISPNSNYARELQTRIHALKRMALDSPSPKASTPVRASPSSSKPPSAASKELQEKQRAIDEAFGF